MRRPTVWQKLRALEHEGLGEHWLMRSGPRSVSDKGRNCRLKAAECERRAVATKDDELRQYYIGLAKDWWAMALQVERLEAEIESLKARVRKIQSEALRAAPSAA